MLKHNHCGLSLPLMLFYDHVSAKLRNHFVFWIILINIFGLRNGIFAFSLHDYQSKSETFGIFKCFCDLYVVFEGECLFQTGLTTTKLYLIKVIKNC